MGVADYIGDRVWANGHWIFDCGHGRMVENKRHFRTELHPPRALATIRSGQVKEIPEVGPIEVTAVDLYIHGQAGMVTDILECGPEVLIGKGSCDFAPEPHRGTPINENFTFDFHLPSRPPGSEGPVVFQEIGPGNTVDTELRLEQIPPNEPRTIRVTVPLAGTRVTPRDVYARKIYVGWSGGRQTFRHLRVRLTKMNLHEDHETDPGDCECTFFWINLDKALDEWHRLVDFEIPTDDQSSFPCPSQTNHMNDWDDDDGCGNGELRFSGPVWEFRIPDGNHFNIRVSGYDQDCLDGKFGDHSLSVGSFLECYTAGNGDNDEFKRVP